MVARAEAIAPTLVPRQAETEQRTFYAEDTHEEFRKAGFYRLLVPRRFGGYEFGIDTFLRVAMILARACPSTGWMYTLGAAHALPVATLFDERPQADVFAGGDFICPATVAPNGTATRAPDGGGWIVDGTWPYCSGSPYATHFFGHTLVSDEDGAPPHPMAFIIPRERWRRLDDWGNQLGLRGTGSHSIRIDNGYVPDHLTMPMHLSECSVTDGTPGLRLHDNPQYGGGQLSFMMLESAAVAVGIAQGALDAYDELMRTRTTFFPPVVARPENVDYQFWYGEAAGMIATAEAACLQAIQQWQDTCGQGPAAFTREYELRLATMCGEIAKLAWHAVEGRLFPSAGSSSSVRQGQRLERAWRDMSTLRSHAGFAVFLTTIAQRELAMARFGVQ
jgi:3-hydroxy-9,10-secoandrosta-1,3,5(10)-triene-9,17-dione monooxygenase